MASLWLSAFSLSTFWKGAHLLAVGRPWRGTQGSAPSRSSWPLVSWLRCRGCFVCPWGCRDHGLWQWQHRHHPYPCHLFRRGLFLRSRSPLWVSIRSSQGTPLKCGWVALVIVGTAISRLASWWCQSRRWQQLCWWVPWIPFRNY